MQAGKHTPNLTQMATLVERLIQENLLPASEQEFLTGDLLFSLGDKPDRVYFLVRGKVCLFSPDPEQRYQIMPPGSLIGLSDIMSDAHRKTALVAEASYLRVLERDQLLQVLEQNPALRLFFSGS